MPLLRTPLFDWHNHHGGRMVEFGGWEMPVQYTSIVEEHQAVRHAVGLFDISHMGRLSFRGADALRLLNQLLTCRVEDLTIGQIRYGLVCNIKGGILDDVLVNRVDEQSFGLVVNASNREKIKDWIDLQIRDFKRTAASFDLEFDDRTLKTAMIAIQGPQSLPVVNKVLQTDVSSMRYYSGRSAEFEGAPAFISRTGYTGEDGFEVIVPADKAVAIWESVLNEGQSSGIKVCGLGCRDTLRLEAAMPLYGHELTEAIDPVTAGLNFAVKLDKPEFNGRDALLAISKHADRPERVGLKLASRRIAREHSQVFVGTDRVGEVTSGTFSPTLERSIAMAYVTATHASISASVEVDIRGKREAAEIVALPFYKRAKK